MGPLARLRALETRLKGEHALFPVAVAGGAVLYLLLAVALSVASRASPLALFHDPFIVATGTLAFASFWGGAALLAIMGFPRIFLFATVAQGGGFVGLTVRALREPLTPDAATLTVVHLFVVLAFGVLCGLVAEGIVLLDRLRRERRSRATPRDAHRNP